MPKISVVMPIYNCVQFLRESIESILNQTFYNFEFIIINDGSTDNSADIIKSYQDRRIRLFDHNDNIGLTKRLNMGIREAKGEYIARMDGDDIALPMRFEKQLDFLEKNKEYGLCGSKIEIIENKEYFFPNWVRETEDEMIRIVALFHCPLCHPSVMIRAETLKKHSIKYDEDFITSQDYKMWIDIMKYSKLKNLPEVLLKYRIHDSQITLNKTESQLKKREHIIVEQLNNLGINPTKNELTVHLVFSPILSNMYLSILKSWTSKLKKSNYTKRIYKEDLFDFYIDNIANIKKERFKKMLLSLKLGNVNLSSN